MEKLLINSLKTSSVDLNIESRTDFQHKLLSNNSEKIISTLRKELMECDEFIISVAFITEGGVALLLEQLKMLEEKGIKGKILTGDYLNFTHPKALKRLLKYKNIELKMLSNEKFHAKGYFFKKGEIWSLIIGSSNLTQSALTTNFEWNLKINSLENGKITKEVLDNFNDVFENIPILDLIKLENYKKTYNTINEYNNSLKEKNYIEKSLVRIEPNFMQKEALNNLKELRKKENKGLLISATGTGKTYLSAFDILEEKPKRMLFIAHRKNILEKSKKTFENIIKNKKIEIYQGDNQEAEYLFGMVQTLSKQDHLEKFDRDTFDYIIIDEVHHSGAESYQNIIDYFNPRFLLGMTATPERSDDFNIYELFDHNIAYEIRLYDALKENLLCPFHYFGISDIIIDGKSIDEKTNINYLLLDERVNHILEKSDYYGYSGETLHGLIFVSRIEEAYELAKKFNKRGRKSIALSGLSTDKEREETIEKLERGEIEYIISVDIFNEGIDIPCVNQVILLRPTESSIVYIQQLGRGLRKNLNKEFVVILDFIGNYEKNFLIPIAISQNNNYDKDFLKRFLNNGTNMIPGESSIIFEEIVKERIFENINKSNFSTKKIIEHDFKLLKQQLGRIPLLYDFFKGNMIDPSVILKFRKDYDEVLRILKPKEEFPQLSQLEKNYLVFLSSFFTPSKRLHEILILKYTLLNTIVSTEEIKNILKKEYNLKNQENNLKNATKHLSKEIFTSLSTMKAFEPLLIFNKENYYLSGSFKNSYKNNLYFKMLIDDLIKYNLSHVNKNYEQISEECILKYKEYTKQEGFWYLNLDFNNGYQVSGYTVFEKERKVVLFITLDEANPFTDYKNNFIDKWRFPWFSKSNRCLERNGTKTVEGKIADNYYTLEAFAKKKIGENFYYLGPVEKVENSVECFGEKGNALVKYILKLKYEIPEDLFNYLDR